MDNIVKLPSRIATDLLESYQIAEKRWYNFQCFCEMTLFLGIILFVTSFTPPLPEDHSHAQWAMSYVDGAYPYDPGPASLVTKIALAITVIAGAFGLGHARQTRKWIGEAKSNLLKCFAQHQPALLMLLHEKIRLE